MMLRALVLDGANLASCTGCGRKFSLISKVYISGTGEDKRLELIARDASCYAIYATGISNQSSVASRSYSRNSHKISKRLWGRFLNSGEKFGNFVFSSRLAHSEELLPSGGSRIRLPRGVMEGHGNEPKSIEVYGEFSGNLLRKFETKF